jgi:hypothetical protein
MISSEPATITPSEGEGEEDRNDDCPMSFLIFFPNYSLSPLHPFPQEEGQRKKRLDKVAPPPVKAKKQMVTN